jgi:biopolymer transport protein ExbB
MHILGFMQSVGAAPASSSVPIDSMWDFAVKGGPLMVPIGLCSLVALAVIVERLISLRRRQIVPPQFWPGLERILERGSPFPSHQALSYCDENPCPIATVITAGIRKLGQPVAAVEKAVLEAGQREVLKLRKHTRMLAVIASVSPLLGLLGTIFGLIRAFQTVAESAEALGRTEMLASGIYEAMITTAAGLLVAIPALLAYHYLHARVEARVSEMDEVATRFIDVVSEADRRPLAFKVAESGAEEPAAAAV